MYVYNEIYRFTSARNGKYQIHFVQIMLYAEWVFIFQCLLFTWAQESIRK